MGSRIQSHQLSNGLYVSGRPDQLPKEKTPTIGSRAIPYTGGDVKKSGELGKMFDIHLSSDHHATSSSKLSRPSSSSQPNSGSFSVRSGSNSGPLPKKSSGPNSGSGPLVKKTSGPIPLPTTGLITSGPLSTRQQVLEHTSSIKKPVYGSAVTVLSGNGKEEVDFFPYKLPRMVMWAGVVVIAMALLVGTFLTVAVRRPFFLAAAGALLVLVIGLGMWNCVRKKVEILGFVNRHPDAELRSALDGQYVKVTGVVTCGSIPLESSYQRVPRCVYVSTELCEYRGWGGKSANPKHRAFSWGSRYSEKHVADFYISDFQSGLRALVKAGYGAKVAVFVKPTTVVEVRKDNKDLSPNFLRWLTEHNISSDERVMRLKEGYIKEGSTVSVMGTVRRHDNVLMIIPPAQPVSTGCHWLRCLVPRVIENLIVKCDDNQNVDVVPV